MTIENLQHTETLLLETLLSALDARESAKRCGSSMLVYLGDMMVQRTRDELEALKRGREALPMRDAAR